MTAPPKLIPALNTFKLGYFAFTFIICCSEVATRSSNDYRQPLLLPFDYPKLTKSYPVLINPFDARDLANYPKLPM